MSTFTLGRAGSTSRTFLVRRTWAALAAFVADVELAISRSHEVQRLLAMSDAALSRRGLRRDGVVQHVMASMPGQGENGSD